MDEIRIRSLEIRACVGVPDAERARAQPLAIDVRIVPRLPFPDMRDDISATIDYAAVCARLAEIAAARPRRLIETLANELAGAIVAEFGAAEAEVEVRKFILPGTDHVAVRCTRRA